MQTVLPKQPVGIEGQDPLKADANLQNKSLLMVVSSKLFILFCTKHTGQQHSSF